MDCILLERYRIYYNCIYTESEPRIYKRESYVQIHKFKFPQNLTSLFVIQFHMRTVFCGL